jgi:hypothetical protein
MTNISNKERERRRSAFEFALASVQLSGLTPSAEALEKAKQFIEGEIELDEFIRANTEFSQGKR